MKLRITSMTEDAAHAITAWRYEPPYSFYDSTPQDLENLLNPEYAYFAIHTSNDKLIGFCCFGVDARVHGGQYDDPNASTIEDVGVGLRPDLAGKGFGRTFLAAVLEFRLDRSKPTRFGATIATFNRRSIRLFEHLGFVKTHIFRTQTNQGGTEFVQMVRPARQIKQPARPT